MIVEYTPLVIKPECEAYYTTTSIGTASAPTNNKELENVDKHIDELEEDIDYLNKERQFHDANIKMANDRIDELERSKNNLEKEVETLKAQCAYLMDMINELLKVKSNDKMS